MGECKICHGAKHVIRRGPDPKHGHEVTLSVPCEHCGATGREPKRDAKPKHKPEQLEIQGETDKH